MAGLARRGVVRCGSTRFGKAGMEYENMKDKTKEKIKTELERIRAMNPDGLLKPEDVEREARDKNNPLHPLLLWDDSEAARKYRLIQVRWLIKDVIVIGGRTTYKPGTHDATDVPVYVSLGNDRKADGGYRVLAEVVNSDELRAQLLADAEREMEFYATRYRTLAELQPGITFMRECITKAKEKIKA